MDYKIIIIEDMQEKRAIARQILCALPEWFGIPESTRQYIEDSVDQTMAAAFIQGSPVGFICLKQTGDATAELAVLGVRKEYHRHGIGRNLFEAVRKQAKLLGFSFLQVKTVQSGRYEEYDRTNLFYKSLGFREFEVLPTLWGEKNPCQIYVMSL